MLTTLYNVAGGTNYVRATPWILPWMVNTNSSDMAYLGLLWSVALTRHSIFSAGQVDLLLFQLLAYAPQLGSRLHIDHTQLNMIGRHVQSLVLTPH